VFFSKDELEEGVTIKIARWVYDKGKTEILVWLKMVDGEWVVFTSRKNQVMKNTLWRIYL
jgi:hypothetical protein